MDNLFPYPLLTWLPDETFFSLVSRCHHLWGHQVPWRTSEILFGARRGGWQHDLPNRVAEFEKRSMGTAGTAEAIIRQRTLLRYYLPFLSEADARDHVLAMRGSTVAHLKLRLGLLTSRFRANHPLKACVECMASDKSEYGWAYWHLEHQYPGNWICARHQRWLRECRMKSNGSGRFQWCLPELEWLEPALPEDVLRSAVSIGDTVRHVVMNAEPSSLDEASVQAALLGVFDAQGWLTDAGHLRLTRGAQAFAAYAAPLRAIPEFSALPSCEAEATTQLGRLLRPMRSGTHPLRHLALANWLFSDGASFLDACARAHKVTPPPLSLCDGEMSQDPMPDPRKVRLKDLLTEQGLSARAAANVLGVDIVTVIAWAAEQGIPTRRRPKVLKEEKYETLLNDLEGGMEKSGAAATHCVSVATVTRILRTTVGLRERWRKARFDTAQEAARTEWSALVTSSGHLGTRFLRAMAPASYAWLYRHDREWLNACDVPSRVLSSDSRRRVRWDERDAMFRAEVEAVALSLVRGGMRRIGLGDLCQGVPTLRPKLSALDRMPLTRQAIERALSYRADRGEQLF